MTPKLIVLDGAILRSYRQTGEMHLRGFHHVISIKTMMFVEDQAPSRRAGYRSPEGFDQSIPVVSHRVIDDDESHLREAHLEER
jgi:hypothetical protein